MAATQNLTRSQRMVKVATISANALIFSGVTSIAVLLPHLQNEFHVPRDTVNWVIIGALLPIAAFVTVSGRIGDLFGRRRLFLAGMILYGLASLACALAPSAGVLIGGRLLQGVGAALVVPLWRWLFWTDVTASLLIIACTLRYMIETRGPPGQSLDLWGVLLLSAGLTSVVLSCERSDNWGITHIGALGLMVLGLLLLGAFVAFEHRVQDPLLDLRRLRTQPYSLR
jgi:MFS family permease